jgi:hypothetical protein
MTRIEALTARAQEVATPADFRVVEAMQRLTAAALTATPAEAARFEKLAFQQAQYFRDAEGNHIVTEAEVRAAAARARRAAKKA